MPITFRKKRTHKITQAQAKQTIRDAQMRKTLYRLLWVRVEKETRQPDEIPEQPFPDINDDYYTDELRRILGID